jgi:hypothetical protein
VAIIVNQGSVRPSKKRKTQDCNNIYRQSTQVLPFKPEGKFKSIQSMDITYTIEPQTRWQNMARYHNFVRERESVDKLVKYLQGKYNLREEEFKWYLGIRVIRDRPSRKIYLCQDAYIDKILKPRP